MALIKCPECEKEISDKAAACPYCGCPASDFSKIPDISNENKKSINKLYYLYPIIGGIVIIVFIVTLISGVKDAIDIKYPIIIISVLICEIILGLIGKSILTEKGYKGDNNNGFPFGFWLGVIGLIICACKPNLKNNLSYANEIEKYKKLLDSKAISQKEYDIAKDKLLNEFKKGV